MNNTSFFFFFVLCSTLNLYLNEVIPLCTDSIYIHFINIYFRQHNYIYFLKLILLFCSFSKVNFILGTRLLKSSSTLCI